MGNMRVVFETATVADVISKASKVAPTKGAAFDKAAGILMTLNGDTGNVEIRVTNLDIYYLEIVDVVEMSGSGSWRFPSSLLDGILSKLPIGSGKQVVLDGDDREVSLKSGRTSAKLRTFRTMDFPTWDPFDSSTLEVVDNLGARIEQVEWAADSNAEPPVSGIHIDGERIVATDRIRLASVECTAAPIYKPITVPAGILRPVMRSLRDVAVGIEEGMFLLMPDPSTQIKTVIFGGTYPNLDKVMTRTEPDFFKFKKSEFIDIISRASVFGQNDRAPELDVILGRSELAVMMSDADQGFLGDVMEVDGADHPRVKFKFTPKNLQDALNAAPSAHCEIYYSKDQVLKPFRLDGGSTFEAWIMPRRDMAPK